MKALNVHRDWFRPGALVAQIERVYRAAAGSADGRRARAPSGGGAQAATTSHVSRMLRRSSRRDHCPQLTPSGEVDECPSRFDAGRLVRLAERAAATGQPWADELADTVDAMLEIAYFVDTCEQPCPVVLTHRDIHPWNLLARRSTGRLDWEISGTLDLASELGSTALSLSKGPGFDDVDPATFRSSSTATSPGGSCRRRVRLDRVQDQHGSGPTVERCARFAGRGRRRSTIFGSVPCRCARSAWPTGLFGRLPERRPRYAAPPEEAGRSFARAPPRECDSLRSRRTGCNPRRVSGTAIRCRPFVTQPPERWPSAVPPGESTTPSRDVKPV